MPLDPFIQIRRELHQIPEIGLKETATQAYLLNKIRQLGIAEPQIKRWRTGLLVKLPGTSPEKIVAWRTDIDGLPVEEETGAAFHSLHPGQMHACGHDFHMAIALGLLKYFTMHPPKDDLLFLFQPAEENEAGGMLFYQDHGFGDELPDEIYALHVNPELPAGVISTHIGTMCAGTCEVKIRFKGREGHAAYPHLANDMIVAASAFIQQVQTIVSRNVDPLKSAVVTFGSFHAGKTNNVISGAAELFGTIRTLDDQTNQLTQKRIQEIARGVAESFACEVEIDLKQQGYLPVTNDPATTQAFLTFLHAHPEIRFQDMAPTMTGEDFGYLLHQIPGTFFWLGVDSPYPLHSAHFAPKEDAIPQALKVFSQFLTTRVNG